MYFWLSLVDDLAWLLEETSRGNIDPKGKDRERLEQWVRKLLDSASRQAVDEIGRRLAYGKLVVDE